MQTTRRKTGNLFLLLLWSQHGDYFALCSILASNRLMHWSFSHLDVAAPLFSLGRCETVWFRSPAQTGITQLLWHHVATVFTEWIKRCRGKHMTLIRNSRWLWWNKKEIQRKGCAVSALVTCYCYIDITMFAVNSIVRFNALAAESSCT